MAEKIASLYAEIYADTSKLEQGLKNTKSDLQKTTTETTKTKASFADFAKTLAVVAGVAASVGVAIKKVYDIAKAGAEIQYTEDRFNRLAESIGTTSDVLMNDLREATRGLYSDSELMNSATQMMALGLAKTSDEAVRLATVAGGLNMNMNQLVLTLTNQTTMRFDALGVSVDGFEEKVKALEETGMSASDAFKEAFLQQAEEQITRVGNAADSNIGKFMTFEANIKNIGDDLKKLSTNALIPLIEDIANFTGALSDLTSKITGVKGTKFSDFFWDLNAAISPVYFWLQNFDEIVSGIGTKSIPDMILAVVEGNKALEWMADILRDVFNGWEQFFNILTGKGIQATEDEGAALYDAGVDAGYYADQAEIAAGKTKELAGASQEVYSTMSGVNLAMQEYNRQLLFAMASEGLTADQAFILAEKMGLVDETTVGAYEAIGELKDELANDETFDEAADSVARLADGLDRLPADKHVRVVYTEVYNRVMGTGYANSSGVTGMTDTGGSGGTNNTPPKPGLPPLPGASNQALGGFYETSTPTLYKASETGQPETAIFVPQGKSIYDVATPQQVAKVMPGGGMGNVTNNYYFEAVEADLIPQTIEQLKALAA